MKLFISEENAEIMASFADFDITDQYEKADTVLIVPGGMSSLFYISNGVLDGKDVYLYNEDDYFAPLLSMLYRAYEEGKEDKSPFEEIKVEKNLHEIIKMMEEKKNGKTNNGKIS